MNVFPAGGRQQNIIPYCRCIIENYSSLLICIYRVNKMKKNLLIITAILAAFFISSCASFLEDEDIPALKAYENNIYILNADAGEGTRTIKKGSRIKIFLKIGDDSIKVYGYPSDADFLKSERTLILYLFEDDFNGSRFDKGLFEEKLYKLIQQDKK